METVTAREAVRVARLGSEALDALEQSRPAMALHFVPRSSPTSRAS